MQAGIENPPVKVNLEGRCAGKNVVRVDHGRGNLVFEESQVVDTAET